MPCYTAWNEYLPEGTPEYDRARAEVQARLLAVKHIVDYYHTAAGVDLPPSQPPAGADSLHQPTSEKERRIWNAIAHHCACDGIHFHTLYDVSSLPGRESERDRSYERVILGCAHLM